MGRKKIEFDYTIIFTYYTKTERAVDCIISEIGNAF